MQDECELIHGRCVEVGDLNLEQVLGKLDEGHQVLFLGDVNHVVNDSIQNVMGKCSRCQPVVLLLFDDIFVVPDN
jgi:hypothetical protein